MDIKKQVCGLNNMYAKKAKKRVRKYLFNSFISKRQMDEKNGF